ncbi:MAG: TetR family transcriptional regulator [Pseudomonas sp.]|nr:TetR family transcriptional regulator [Pseudomonas sp.]
MRRTKEEAENTRTAILAAAELLFLKKGVSHTSLEHIAREAGVTRGAVYWHFQNKAHLFHEMLNQVRLPAEQIAKHISQCDPNNPILGLRNLCADALLTMDKEPRKKRIFTILLRRCEFTDDLREAEERHEAFINEFIDLCEQLFAEPTTAKLLYPGVSPRMAALSLHAMLLGLLSDWLRDPTLFNVNQAGYMLDALFRGLIQNWESDMSKNESLCSSAQDYSATNQSKRQLP